MPGLGKLVRVDRKARVGRNPATGETINIPAKKVVKFRVSKSVKDAIVPAKAKKVICVIQILTACSAWHPARSPRPHKEERLSNQK